MPVNQSPEYLKAEERFRQAATPEARLAALEEMLRLVPKHKGSEKLQAQIKQRIKAARKEVQQPKSRGTSHRDLFAVPKQGAGQVVLLGEANVGKSSIVRALTKAKVEVADFPFSTPAAVPAMAHHQDVPIQLVDMPPVMDGQAPSGAMGTYRSADLILLVVDLSAIDLLDQFERPQALLGERGMRLVPQLSLEPDGDESARQPKPALVAANKYDTPGAQSNLDGLKELCGSDLRILPVSATTRQGLKEMVAALFELLGVIRVYAKKPGKAPDMSEPFILARGATVADLAAKVHRELANKLKHARVWGKHVHDGQQVHRSHVLADKDVVELHF